MNKKKLLIVTTGGTIASLRSEADGYSPQNFNFEELFGLMPKSIRERIEITHWQYSNMLSFAMTPHMIIHMTEQIMCRVQQEQFDAVVVTQGTAMLEESPFLADLFWSSSIPIVFTGAMLNKSEPDWDGPRNVCNAAVAALSRESRGKGVLVTLGGEIHTARDVTKTHKTSLSPLFSFNGPIGVVVNCERTNYYRIPVRRKVFSKFSIDERVEIIKASIGSSGIYIDTLVEAGYRGAIIEALPGGGGVPKDVFDAIKRNVDKMIFVMCPRSQAGVCISSAGGGMGPVDLQKMGVVTAGDLSSVKARLFLMAALNHFSSVEEIRDEFLRFTM